MAHTLKWFTNRIGKRIYRNKEACKCPSCLKVNEEGLIISNLEYAQYLQTIENDYEAEGIKINYRDKK